MGIQINGSTDRITAIDGTIDFVSNIGNIGLITASNYVLQDAITIGAGSTVIKTVNGTLGIGIASPTRALTIAKQDNELSGTTRSGWTVSIVPKPLQVGHIPDGLLKEKSLGVGGSTLI